MLTHAEIELLETLAAHCSARNSQLELAITRAHHMQRQGVPGSGLLLADLLMAREETRELWETVKDYRSRNRREHKRKENV